MDRKQIGSGILSLLSAGFILLNVIAYRHAYAMLHFTHKGVRTAKPEALSVREKAIVLFTGVNVPRPVNELDPGNLDLTFETHTYPSSDGLELEAWYIPAKRSKGLVLLFHGYAKSKASMLSAAKMLHQCGYSTFLADFRGSGGSEGNDTTIGFKEADDVAASVKSARSLSPDGPLILYGQSMGGAAVLRAIAVHGVAPDVLVIEAVFDGMLSTVKARFSVMGVPSFPAAHLLTYWGGRQMGFSALKHNPEDYARSVRCPTLVLHGEKDRRATLDQAKNIMDRLDCPTELVLFGNVAHSSCYAADPLLWRQSVVGFCERWTQAVTQAVSVKQYP